MLFIDLDNELSNDVTTVSDMRLLWTPWIHTFQSHAGITALTIKLWVLQAKIDDHSMVHYQILMVGVGCKELDDASFSKDVIDTPRLIL